MKATNAPTLLLDGRFGAAASTTTDGAVRQKTIGMDGRIRYGTPLLNIFRHRTHQATKVVSKAVGLPEQGTYVV
ncbi:MAG: hypothetical protein JJ920_01170 [Roseitalea sp.]|jgi:hypothetical protein|nr:hypothetical protein [Roseitalea sp.]MBO6741491.1 hypothetical protein [Roseitalea sp.]